MDYDTAPRDSTTHFALVGFDHHLTEQLGINVLGGSSFRSFKDDGNSIDPYGEVGINYQGGNHSLSWLTTYGVSQPTQTLAMGTTTFRTGLSARYQLTSLISARAAVYYHHNDNQGSSGTTSAGSDDALQFTLGLNYRINKRWAVHADYAYLGPALVRIHRGRGLFAESLLRRRNIPLLKITAETAVVQEAV